MIRVLFIINALLTIPFGILALIAPEALFLKFGMDLPPAGVLVARGYAATLISYGLVLFLMRNTTDRSALKAFLYSMAIFNLIETIIQGIAGTRGVANAMIWGTAVTHSGIFALCVIAIARRKPS